MAVCCKNLTLGALNSHSALSMLVGALFKKFDLFLNKILFLKSHLVVLFSAVYIYLSIILFLSLRTERICDDFWWVVGET
jgi:hypothetical protein